MTQQRNIGRRDFLRWAAVATGAAGIVLPRSATEAAPAEKLGGQYIGKLEGPEILRDVSAFPKQFKEAPMLAELVKAGKLPPLA